MSSDFGGKPFSLVHYLAIKSAITVNQPSATLFHFAYEPDGYYWEKVKPFLTLCPVAAPNEIFGKTLRHYAHKSDIVRMKVLLEHGGIYMDLDTISKRSVAPLLTHKAVLGKEGNVGLCNAVILAEKNAEFLQIWLNTYHDFDPDEWGYHSVILPLQLAPKYPTLLHMEEGDSFHFPLHTASLLYEECHDYPKAYIHHLWQHLFWDYLKVLDEERILTHDTTYNVIARRFL
jgi:hypothetical protein